MSLFRVAICLSGQARHWRVSAKNIKNFFETHKRHTTLEMPIHYDYFFHTWDTNTWRYPKTQHTVFREEKHNDEVDLVKEFNPVDYEVEKWVPENFLRAWDPMFYSFSKSLLMKRNYEIKHNFEYDVVIKARFDIIYNPQYSFDIHMIKPGFNGLMPGFCYNIKPIGKFQNEFNYNCFDDVMFFGDSRTMDLVSDLYDTYKITHIKENHNSLDVLPSFYYGPGTLLYEHMINMGIHPQLAFYTEYVVVRSTALENGLLDSIDDYEKIKEKYIEWYL